MLTQLDKGYSFHALHQGTRAFVIANVWDAGSARVLASAAKPRPARTRAAPASQALGMTNARVP